MANISKIQIENTIYDIKDDLLRNHSILVFDTVSDMTTSDDIVNNTVVKTLGFHTKNDGGSAYYLIRSKEISDTDNNMDLFDLDDDTLVAELIYDEITINPKTLGAKLDGTTDDTDIIEYALSKGNVKLPYQSDVFISELQMVEYRELDFNDSEVNSNGNAIKIGDNSYNSYTRNAIIKNGHFNNEASSGTANSIYTIYLGQAIRCKLENITASHINNGCVGIYIENSFNININGVYLGNGNQAKTSGSAGIIAIATTPTVAGTNNLTNISIEHGLIQNVTAGINYKISNGSIDTSVIDDIGLSNCDNGYVIEGSSSTAKNIKISNSRVESTNIGVYNFGATTLDNVMINFINLTTAIGIYNRSSGRLTVQGYIGFIGTSTSIINQSGAWADFSNSFPALNPATAPASLQAPIVRPLHVESSTHNGTDFSAYVHPFYDYQLVQTSAFTISNLPSGCQNGTKLIIGYNGTLYNCLYQNNQWHMN